MMRIIGLFLPSGKDRPLPNIRPNRKTGAGGWSSKLVQALVNHTYNATTTRSINQSMTKATVQAFDVMILRIPFGWIKLDKSIHKRIQESFLVANRLFRVQTIILHSIFFNNNVKTEKDFRKLQQVNQQLRVWVNDWKQNETLSSVVPNEKWGKN